MECEIRGDDDDEMRARRRGLRTISAMHQCDKTMRELFDGVARAIDALGLLLGFARIAAEVAQIGGEARETLAEARNKYDLVAVRYLVADRGEHYFSAVSCANIESTTREIGVMMYVRISRMRDKYVVRESADDTVGGSRDVAVARGLYSRGTVSRAGVNTKRAIARGGRVRAAPVVEIRGESHRSADELCEFAQIAGALGVACEAIARECGIEVAAASAGVGGIGGMDDSRMKCASCGNVLSVRSRADDSMVCDKCGRIDMSRVGGGRGGVSPCGDDLRAEVMMSRRAGSHHLRHLKSWMDRLQAIENYDIRGGELDRVRQSMLREFGAIVRISWCAVRCVDVARHIALCGLSHLNKHVPKVVKALGGRAPPIFTYDAVQIIIVDFEHIMEIYPKLVSGPGNKPYYPFFISKIVRMRFAGNAELLRITQYITQQGYDTVKKNDHIFEQICKLAPAHYALKYQPEIE